MHTVLCLILAVMPIAAQSTLRNPNYGANKIAGGSALPSSCADSQLYFVTGTGLYQCVSGAWVQVGSGTAGSELSSLSVVASSAPGYGNPLSTGDRRTSATVTGCNAGAGCPNNWLVNNAQATLPLLVDGNRSGGFEWGDGAIGSGSWILFDLSSQFIIDGFKWFQSNTADLGSWRLEASNDGTNFTALGDAFALGGGTSQTVLRSNATPYRYYRLYSTTGFTGSSANTAGEIEFSVSANLSSTEAMSVTGKSTLTGDLVLPEIKAASGTRYICIDTNGKIVSQTTACSGT